MFFSRPFLSISDHPNHDRKMGIASEMCDQIRDELSRLYNIDQASKQRQGLDQYGHVDLFNEYQLGINH